MKPKKFKVIKGSKKDAKWWHSKYKSIIDDILINLDPLDRYQYMKLCRYLVKDFNCICSYDDNHPLIFKTGTEITSLLARLTPKEFLITFVPKKTYDGDKYECIDYFSTIEKFSSMDKFYQISEKSIEDVLWGYDNSDILNFTANIMCAMSKLYKEYNGIDMLDDFMLSMGEEPLTKYYEVKTPSGKKVFVDEAGKKVGSKKVDCRDLEVIK